MASTGRQSPEAHDDDMRWRTAGDRIQILLDASAGSGTVVRERTEQLAGELTDLYGAALERMVSIAARSSAPDLINQFAADELVASLLLVHGLHPHGVERRIEDALDDVRPYLGSHGGDVTLIEVVDDVVRLQFAGSCKSCPSSAVTLEFAVEDAVRAAAPEIVTIEVVAAEPDSAAASGTPGLISVDSLMSRVHTIQGERSDGRSIQGERSDGRSIQGERSDGRSIQGERSDGRSIQGERSDGRSIQGAGVAWHPIPDISDLGSGEVGGFLVAGVPILACRVGDELFAYHDRCGRCRETLAGAQLHRPMGAPIGEAVLRCPRCHAHFDAVHAGAGLGENPAHLEPIPLLLRDGVLSVAVLAEATEVM
ncbi:NifU family protein [Mycolicibacterium sp. P9-64]|uniref:NifU family protein n=1 Tax=Mycolicibacterium sp. P9-64 TaxID=2024612 RepID=UPI001F5B1BEF|nr:NifU family protein [Mycolicibacterium sp. P9-64]